MKPQDCCPNCKKTSKDTITLTTGKVVPGFVYGDYGFMCFHCRTGLSWSMITKREQ